MVLTSAICHSFRQSDFDFKFGFLLHEFRLLLKFFAGLLQLLVYVVSHQMLLSAFDILSRNHFNCVMIRSFYCWHFGVLIFRPIAFSSASSFGILREGCCDSLLVRLCCSMILICAAGALCIWSGSWKEYLICCWNSKMLSTTNELFCLMPSFQFCIVWHVYCVILHHQVLIMVHVSVCKANVFHETRPLSIVWVCFESHSEIFDCASS